MHFSGSNYADGNPNPARLSEGKSGLVLWLPFVCLYLQAVCSFFKTDISIQKCLKIKLQFEPAPDFFDRFKSADISFPLAFNFFEYDFCTLYLHIAIKKNYSIT